MVLSLLFLFCFGQETNKMSIANDVSREMAVRIGDFIDADINIAVYYGDELINLIKKVNDVVYYHNVKKEPEQQGDVFVPSSLRPPIRIKSLEKLSALFAGSYNDDVDPDYDDVYCISIVMFYGNDTPPLLYNREWVRGSNNIVYEEEWYDFNNNIYSFYMRIAKWIWTVIQD